MGASYSLQLIQLNPIFWKPRDPKLIWKDVIYILDAQLSLCTHFKQGAMLMLLAYSEEFFFQKGIKIRLSN